MRILVFFVNRQRGAFWGVCYSHLPKWSWITRHKISNVSRTSISAGPCAIRHRPEERLSFRREWHQKFYCFQKYAEHNLLLTVAIFSISWLIDINECDDTSLFSCPKKTKCVNLQGSYTCECAPGHESTNSHKIRGLDLQCQGVIILEPEGSGELELLKHFVLSNPQTTGNSSKHSGNSLKRSISFVCWLFLFLSQQRMRLRNHWIIAVCGVMLIERIGQFRILTVGLDLAWNGG